MHTGGVGWRGWLAALLLVLVCWAPAHAEEGEPGLLERTGNMLERTFKSGTQAAAEALGLAEEDAPQRIAVLPATGQGSAGQLEDVRIAIHNGLSSKNFELQRPQEVDLALAAAGLDAAALAGADPAEIARRLQTEGLVYVDVLGIDKVYAGAYAHQEVSVRLRLYSAARNAFIWEKTETQTEREGGLSLSLFGILTTIVTSTRVLTDGVRQALVDRLARTFASNIPQPKSVRSQGQPPAIQVAFSNWGDGPFRAGDEVIVYMKGEPGLSATFDLGRERAGLRLNEKAPGDYLGSYVVRAGDDADNLQVSLRVTRLNPRASIDWRVPGRITLDSTPPGGVMGFRAVPVQAGVRLSWQPPAAGGADLLYVVERTDADGGRYSQLAEVATAEYLDRTVAPGGDYHYRLTPRDAARNTGPQSVARVVSVAPGPTDLAGEIAEDRTLHAVGSPYRVKGTVRVRPTAKLLLEPGSVVEFAEGASLEVLGGIRAQGTAPAPVSLSGRNWRLVLRDTGERDNLFRHTRFEGEGAEIVLSASSAAFEQCVWRGMARALKADDRSGLRIARGQFVQNGTALELANARAGFDGADFRGNDRALVVGEGVEFGAAGLSFEGNRRHVETVRELNLGAARFRDASFADLQGRIEGPVRIDWQPPAEEDDPLRRGLRQEWRAALDSLHAGDLKSAATRLDGLSRYFGEGARSLAAALNLFPSAGLGHAGVSPSSPALLPQGEGSYSPLPQGEGLGVRVRRMDTCSASNSGCPTEVSRLNGLTQGATGRDAPARDAFGQALRDQERAAPGSAWVWVQEVSLPFEPGLPDISSRLMEEADARLARALVGQRYASGNAALAGKANGLGLLRHARARLLLFGERDGAYWRYWVARVLDRPALEGDLRLAGVLERQPSTLVIGLLNQGERSEAVQHLADLLQKQRFRFVQLGQGGYGARTQETARKAGVDLVLETRFSLDVGQTRLAENLKRFEARLTVNFYDVNDLLVSHRFTATGSATDFRETQGADKAVDQAFARIEQDIFASLWRMDEARAERKEINTSLLLPPKR